MLRFLVVGSMTETQPFLFVGGPHNGRVDHVDLPAPMVLKRMWRSTESPLSNGHNIPIAETYTLQSVDLRDSDGNTHRRSFYAHANLAEKQVRETLAQLLFIRWMLSAPIVKEAPKRGTQDPTSN